MQDIYIIGAGGFGREVQWLIERLRVCNRIDFPNLVDPSVLMSERITFGEGNIICAGNILTVNI